MESSGIKIGPIEKVTRFEKIKGEVLSAFHKERVTGLNLIRVENFITSFGLEVKPYIIIEESDMAKLREIDANSGLFRHVNDDILGGGIYIPEVDLVVIYRDPSMEKLNGPIYTEAILVHELAHATCMNKGYIETRENNYIKPRVGFNLPNNFEWGSFLEEGFAEYFRGIYKQKYINRRDKLRLQSITEYGNIKMDDTLGSPDSAGNILPVPFKYLDVTGETSIGVKESAYAGFAIELLMRKNKNLFKVLCNARSSIEALRSLPIELNKMDQGLYLFLQKGEYDMDSFRSKLKYIIDGLLGGTSKVIKSRGNLRKYWQNVGIQ